MQSSQVQAISTQSLHHHFADLDQQRETATLGMWAFLITEIMFFGGLFTAYLVYRVAYSTAWNAGSQGMYFWYGTVNTIVLICSSLFIALGVHAAQMNSRKLLTLFLVLALLLGVVFMVLKGFEYYGHWEEHKVPGTTFIYDGPDSRHVEMFYVLYFFMTGFHALHMLIGIFAVGIIAYWAWHGRYTPEYHNPVENVGLYWHFVDIVWIFLYPLLYLVGHHHTG